MKKILLIAAFFIGAISGSQAQPNKAALSAGLQTTIVRFYPNPATTAITFDFQKTFEQGYSLQIFNAILGRKMYDGSNLPVRSTINLTDFPRGMYIYQLRDKGGRMVESGKFQVAK